MSDATDFVAEVSERARLDEHDARSLIEDFLHALPGFVTRETWDLIADLTPGDVDVDWEEMPPREDRSIEAFLLEMSSEERVESRRAAEHARAVAETIRSRATREQAESLQSAIRDESLLALFETERGELTSQPTRRESGHSSS